MYPLPPQDRFAKLPGHPQCGQGTLECTFDTRGDLPVGPFSLDVPIDLKSGALCMLQLTAEVVVPTVTVSHERLDFGAVRVGQTRVITLQLLAQAPARVGMGCGAGAPGWCAMPLSQCGCKAVVAG